jgi:proprotein convertase subtilisin/kexin type 5
MGFFFNQNNCNVCERNCVSCSSLVRCQLCKNNMENQQGLCACPSGQIQAQLTCYTCASGCTGCLSSPNNCIGCQAGYFLTDSRTCECQPGFFQEGALCQVCGLKCHTCFHSRDFCLICNPGFTMSLPGNCICAPGSFVMGLVCSACGANCQVCASVTTCMSCVFGFVLLQGACLNSCPPQYYPHKGACLGCSNDCPTPLMFKLLNVTQQNSTMVAYIRVTGSIPATIKQDVSA